MFEENFRVYGVRKVWRKLKREGHDVARCTVARLMQPLGLQGVIRGKPVRTTISDKATPCPLDHVNRQFKAARPNALWLSDFTYVATWAGFVYVAFVIDAYARRIVGWRVSRTAHAGFVLDAWNRLCMTGGPASRWARASQRPRQPIRLDQIHRAPGRSRHRAVGGQRRRQLRQCSGRDHQRSLQSRGHTSARTVAVVRGVEFATLEWIDWFNNMAGCVERMWQHGGGGGGKEPLRHSWNNWVWECFANETAAGAPRGGSRLPWQRSLL